MAELELLPLLLPPPDEVDWLDVEFVELLPPLLLPPFDEELVLFEAGAMLD